jgi:HK97 family phage prohead protease
MKFKGYCCTFQIDLNKDIFLPKSFIIPSFIPILYEHKKMIGYITYIKEKNHGLYIEFKIKTFDEFIVRKIFDGFLNNLSIGFIPIKYFYKNNIRYITLVKILEVSIVEKPAQNNTKFYLLKI